MPSTNSSRILPLFFGVLAVSLAACGKYKKEELAPTTKIAAAETTETLEGVWNGPCKNGASGTSFLERVDFRTSEHIAVVSYPSFYDSRCAKPIEGGQAAITRNWQIAVGGKLGDGTRLSVIDHNNIRTEYSFKLNPGYLYLTTYDSSLKALSPSLMFTR